VEEQPVELGREFGAQVARRATDVVGVLLVGSSVFSGRGVARRG
jgi:hypothetical protein